MMSSSSVSSCCLLTLAAAACTSGMVTDGSTGEGIGGVTVLFARLDVSTPTVGGPIGMSFETYASTWDGSTAPAGLYYLNPYAPLAEGDHHDTIVDGGWHYIIVAKSLTASIYPTRFFVRNHQYAPCDAFTDTPYSGGPYAHSTSGGTVAGLCAGQDFVLWPGSANHDLQPDLIVDPRTLLDHEVIPDWENCEDAPGGFTAKCLRFSTGIANVGDGDLHVFAPMSNLRDVKQRIYRGNGHTDTALADAEFEVALGSHGHLHMAGIVDYRLRAVTDACPDEASAAQCPVAAQSGKVGFCLFDNFTFLNGLTSARAYTQDECSANRGASDTVSIGLGRGKEETYDKGVQGQALNLDGLPGGPYWLEAEVNGTRTILESDYGNNLSRVQVQL